jgi:hypothetical protein
VAPPEPRIAALDQLGVALRDSCEQPRPRGRVRVAMVTALALLVVATVTVTTAPGRAVAAWVADLVGLSDDTKPETDKQRLSNAVLIATEASPGGERYEVYADHDFDEGLCFNVLWPGDRRLASCQPTGIRADLAVPIVSALAPGTAAAAGLAPAGTAEVEVTYRRGAGAATDVAPSRVFSLDETLRTELQITPEQDYAFFLAFLPEGIGDIAGPSQAQVVAYDESGEPLGRSPIRWAKTGLADPSIVSCTDGNTVTQPFCAGGPD